MINPYFALCLFLFSVTGCNICRTRLSGSSLPYISLWSSWISPATHHMSFMLKSRNNNCSVGMNQQTVPIKIFLKYYFLYILKIKFYNILFILLRINSMLHSSQYYHPDFLFGFWRPYISFIFIEIFFLFFILYQWFTSSFNCIVNIMFAIIIKTYLEWKQPIITIKVY